MRGAETQQSFFGRISTRRSQVASMEGTHEHHLEEFELFQNHVSDRFSSLLSSTQAAVDHDGSKNKRPVEPLLSIAWLRRLFDVFLCCEAEFKSFLISNRDRHQISKPPLDRLINEFLERSIKLLDICNAVSLGIDNIRQCQRFAEIVVSALGSTPISDGQFKRAKKALTSLHLALTADEREQGSGHANVHVRSPERSWSFGKKPKGTPSVAGNHLQFRSLSTVAKNWSAARQIQAMSANLTAPRGSLEGTTMGAAVHMMSVVAVFTMWAAVAALPCQDRSGLAGCFVAPRHAAWSQGIGALHERIGDEWRRKERSRTGGLLEEMQRLEKLGDRLMEMCNGVGGGDRSHVEATVGEMGQVCRRMEDGLGPLQRQIREVFHRVVRSRDEFLELLDHDGA